MKLVKVTCEIRYAQRMKLLANYESLYTDLLGKQPDRPEAWLVPGLSLQDADQKRVMILDPNRGIINVEQPPNVGFCKDSILRFFRHVNEHFGIPQVGRWGLRSTWVEEYEAGFADLLAKCKRKFFGDSKLATKAADVCAVFDRLLDDEAKTTTTIGPMLLPQLRQQYLTFEPKGLTDVFLYMDVDVGALKTPQYSEKYLADFVARAVDAGEKMATEVVNEVRSEPT